MFLICKFFHIKKKKMQYSVLLNAMSFPTDFSFLASQVEFPSFWAVESRPVGEPVQCLDAVRALTCGHRAWRVTWMPWVSGGLAPTRPRSARSRQTRPPLPPALRRPRSACPSELSALWLGRARVLASNPVWRWLGHSQGPSEVLPGHPDPPGPRRGAGSPALHGTSGGS